MTSGAVADYFASVPPTRQTMLQKLHELISELYPAATLDMHYRMPTYRHGEGWVAIANQKHYVSLYTCGYHHIEAFKRAHPGVRTGKGCINFREKDELPLDDLREVVRHAMDHPKP